MDAEPSSTSPPEITPASSSVAYNAFLAFLRSGCRGLPVEGYPILVVVLSTLPPSLFPLTAESLSTLFSALWSALPGLLATSSSSPNPSSPSSTRSFLSALLECNNYLLTKRLKGAAAAGDEGDEKEARRAAAEQVEKAWVEGVVALAGGVGINKRRGLVKSSASSYASAAGGRRQIVAGLQEAKIVGKGLEKLSNQDQGQYHDLVSNQNLFPSSTSVLTLPSTSIPLVETAELAWSGLVSSTQSLLSTSSTSASPLPASKLSVLLSSLQSGLPASWSERSAAMIKDVASTALSTVETDLGRDTAEEQPSQSGGMVERIELLTEMISSTESAAILKDGTFAEVSC